MTMTAILHHTHALVGNGVVAIRTSLRMPDGDTQLQLGFADAVVVRTDRSESSVMDELMKLDGDEGYLGEALYRIPSKLRAGGAAALLTRVQVHNERRGDGLGPQLFRALVAECVADPLGEPDMPVVYLPWPLERLPEQQARRRASELAQLWARLGSSPIRGDSGCWWVGAAQLSA